MRKWSEVNDMKWIEMKSCSVICRFDLIWLYPFLCLFVSLLVWYMSYGMIYALVCSWSCSWSDGSLLYYMAWIYSIVYSIHKDIIPFHMVQNCTAHSWIAYMYYLVLLFVSYHIASLHGPVILFMYRMTRLTRIEWYDIFNMMMKILHWFVSYRYLDIICISVSYTIEYVMYCISCIVSHLRIQVQVLIILLTIQFNTLIFMYCCVMLHWSGLV